MADPNAGLTQRSRRVTIQGLERVSQMLNEDILLQPEFDLALETFQKRIDRKSKGLGAQRNTLMSTVTPLSARTESTLNYPRTTGEAWTRKMHAAIGAMAPRVIRKAIERIGQRWAGEAGQVR